MDLELLCFSSPHHVPLFFFLSLERDEGLSRGRALPNFGENRERDKGAACLLPRTGQYSALIPSLNTMTCQTTNIWVSQCQCLMLGLIINLQTVCYQKTLVLW
ncbi:hypothetical protein VPH35_111843 [Triticum aestivum]